MPKSLSTFLEECRREIPNEVVHIGKTIDPAHYDATAIIKHLGAQKKFPIAIFDRPLNLHGQVSDFPLVLNCEISQRKTQIALGMPRTLTRSEMAEACLAREAKPIPPIVIDKKDAPVKQNVKRGADVDLFQLPFMRHYEMDGGPYSTLSTITKDRKSGIYNCSYHRMEIKSPNRTALYASPRHLWRMYRDYEEQEHGMSGGDGDGTSSGLSHRRVLHRPVRGQRVRYHRRLSARAAAADAVGDLGRRLADSRRRRDRHRRRADSRQAGGRRAVRRSAGLSRAAALRPLCRIRSAGDQLSQGRHVPVGDHAGRRQAVDGSAARGRVLCGAAARRCRASRRYASSAARRTTIFSSP